MIGAKKVDHQESDSHESSGNEDMAFSDDDSFVEKVQSQSGYTHYLVKVVLPINQ